MKKLLAAIFALTGWFAIITQFIIFYNSRTFSSTEAVIRFFSYFTIQTNILCAVFFSYHTLKTENSKTSLFDKAGVLTALTAYISVVGLVYQTILSKLWSPQGLQKVADEILHGVVPVMVLVFWYLHEKKKEINYTSVLKWTIYPLIYLFVILIRGNFSGFYPYPFIEVNKIGLWSALINSMGVLTLMILLSGMYVLIGKKAVPGQSKESK